MKQYLSITTAIIVSTIALSAHALPKASKIDVVQMQNATNCHIKADGPHYVGKGVLAIGTFSEWGNQYSTIYDIGTSGPVPIINGNSVILDLDMAADEFTKDYKPGDKYIISDDSGFNCYKTVYPGVPGCFKLAPTNPCA